MIIATWTGIAEDLMMASAASAFLFFSPRHHRSGPDNQDA